MLEQRVKRRNQHSRNFVDLRDEILSEWLKLDATYLQNLVDSLPNRIQAIIKSRGGVTWKYSSTVSQTLSMQSVEGDFWSTTWILKILQLHFIKVHSRRHGIPDIIF
ncbi:hypothetical protein AVEN_151379-1 [Araneus ventricosus]|uniref:Uncharacterized protein n=1 Tax=Araneus ventricosus TaxID=182803 RepID=A0A4Y2C9S8_ARAVE|nr:hypothetical protein AVEN_151379-1 [Araneus ventricosus]